MHRLEALEAEHGEGPCVDAYRGVEQVLTPDLSSEGNRWPTFTPEALDAGFQAAAGFPLRRREQCIGALNLFLSARRPFPPTELRAAQAMADAATIGILQERARRRAQERAAQLQHALASRVAIEQAKGIASRALGIDVDEAFERIRRYSQDRNQPLRQVAEHIVAGSVTPEGLPGARQ